MRKSKALEIVIIFSIIAGALIFQFFYSGKEESSPSGDTEKVEVLTKEKVGPDLQKLVHGHIDSLSADALPEYNPYISLLGKIPDWSQLEHFQRTIDRESFVKLLSEIYTTDDSWKSSIEVFEDRAEIQKYTGNKEAGSFTIYFKTDDAIVSRSPVRYWRSAVELGVAPEGKPLEGLVIAIDPGHIGGDHWSEIEERSFALGNDKPVREGEITLRVARMLKPELENLGADVVLVRDALEPVNPKRPGHYQYAAMVELKGRGEILSVPAIDELSDKFFYRVGEIRERSKIVNSIIKPDVVICLHFNATHWGEPGNRVLADTSHFHLLLHGAYTANEVKLDDERFSLLKKILMQNHREEAALAEHVVRSTVKHTKLPPFLYEENSKRAVMVNKNEYLWARNLIANRLYDCPVIYMEPYVMNSKVDYKRIQLGDYEGMKKVDGVMRRSIFREYVDGIVDGFQSYYSVARTPIIQKNEE